MALSLSPPVQHRLGWLAVWIILMPASFSHSQEISQCPDTPGISVFESLQAGTHRNHRCVLDQGESLEFEVEQLGIDVAVIMVDPSGAEISHFDSPTGNSGIEEVWLTAIRPGPHLIRIESVYDGGQSGSYRLRLKSRRSASAKNRARCQAKRAFYRAGKNLEHTESSLDPSGIQQRVESNRQALSFARQAEDLVLQAHALWNLADLEAHTGRLAEAADMLQKANDLWRRADEPGLQSSALLGLATLHIGYGQVEVGVSYSRSAVNQARKASPRWLGFALSSLAQALVRVGRLEEAYAHNRESLQIWRQLDHPAGEVDALCTLAWLHQSAGRPAEALAVLQRALPISRAIQHRDFTTSILIQIGNLKITLGEVETGLEILQQARKVSARRGSLFSQAGSLNALGDSFRNLGRHEQALLFYRQSAEKYGSTHTALEAVPLSSAAKLESALGRIDAALAHARRAVAVVESKSLGIRNSDLLAAFLSTQQEVYQVLVDLFMQAGRPEEALTVHESGRARGLRAFLAYDSQSRQAPTVSQLTEQLAEGSLILEFALGESRSFLFALSRFGLSAFELGPEHEIEARALHLLDLLTARKPQSFTTAAEHRHKISRADLEAPSVIHQLSRDLLAPAAALIQRHKRLIFVPDGALHLIPFAVLDSPGRLPGEPLVLSHELSRAPSSATWADSVPRDPESPPSKTIAVFADPVLAGAPPSVDEPHWVPTSFRSDDLLLGLTPLPGTRREAQVILDLVPADQAWAALGHGADLTALRALDLSDFRIIHFATHAVVDSTDPKRSGMVLSQVDRMGRPVEALLSLPEVHKLELQSDLVVLSACRTALGRPVRGEGLVGLARAFLAAGSSSVIASLWSPSDEATAELMAHFYRAHLGEGLPIAAALREAQLALRHESRWTAPYYWAPFVLQGRADR